MRSLSINVLATHSGRIKERLIAAFEPNLSMVTLAQDSLPPDAKETWDGVWRRVTAIDGTDQSGSFRPSIEAMEDAEAVKIAEDIMSVQALVSVELHFSS